MLFEFNIENYRSFRDKQVFSFLPDEAKKELPVNVQEVDGHIKQLTSCVVYGANASGKSNLMKAFQTFRNLILTSATNTPDDTFKEYDPYKFRTDTAEAPTTFEISFFVAPIRYKYLVSILKDSVIEERLYSYPQGREAKLFTRKRQKFVFGDLLKGQKTVIANLTGKNQLFLSKAAQNNQQQLIGIYQFFSQDFMPIPFLDSWVDSQYTDRIVKELLSKSKDLAFIDNFKTLLKSFDTGIVDFNIEKSDFTSEREYEIEVAHTLYDADGKEVGVKKQAIGEESTGTQKLFVMGGLILRALMNSRVIIIDEFERSLHPHISSYIIELFHNPKINTKGAQLIIATHDSNLLASTPLRRDQIWIVEKDNQGVSELFSLADINGVPANKPFEKWYLSGKLGGIPGIGRLNFELSYEH